MALRLSLAATEQPGLTTSAPSVTSGDGSCEVLKVALEDTGDGCFQLSHVSALYARLGAAEGDVLLFHSASPAAPTAFRVSLQRASSLDEAVLAAGTRLPSEAQGTDAAPSASAAVSLSGCEPRGVDEDGAAEAAACADACTSAATLNETGLHVSPLRRLYVVPEPWVEGPLRKILAGKPSSVQLSLEVGEEGGAEGPGRRIEVTLERRTRVTKAGQTSVRYTVHGLKAALVEHGLLCEGHLAIEMSSTDGPLRAVLRRAPAAAQPPVESGAGGAVALRVNDAQCECGAVGAERAGDADGASSSGHRQKRMRPAEAALVGPTDNCTAEPRDRCGHGAGGRADTHALAGAGMTPGAASAGFRVAGQHTRADGVQPRTTPNHDAKRPPAEGPPPQAGIAASGASSSVDAAVGSAGAEEPGPSAAAVDGQSTAVAAAAASPQPPPMAAVQPHIAAAAPEPMAQVLLEEFRRIQALQLLAFTHRLARLPAHALQEQLRRGRALAAADVFAAVRGQPPAPAPAPAVCDSGPRREEWTL
ncbi:hypothetical protein HYH03_006433 [Edaphochlamys debaryana]|uniref:Uncharacterized protein n=1 Tax=Edaphochlamys debaryana TaxID=47281 RepID=A0A836C1G0_9CHLO|nr:hypothetical protein HYH03_006433 [Edaphochlamys debaryana]|eukprot:KAG2495489.1 hypothetical protein HYH03_006433 [Edaphochlamys debaryana]